MNKPTVLIVDDSPDFRLLLSRYCRREGYETESLSSAESLFKRLGDIDNFCAVLLDILMPGADGFEALARIRKASTKVPVIMTTALDDAESIIRSLRMGAFDYITKPVDQTRLSASLRNAVGNFALRNEIDALSSRMTQNLGFRSLIGQSESMNRVRDAITLASSLNDPVLFHGEDGTGKALAARALHQASSFADTNWAALDCAILDARAMNRHLEEGEAAEFGQDGATFFFDNIHLADRECQDLIADLVRRSMLDGDQADALPIRVVAASEISPEELQQSGEFNTALLNHLSASAIAIEPLRKRADDIPALADAFLRQACEDEKRHIRAFAPATMYALEQHLWPGNVRELNKVIERAVMLSAGDVVLPEALPPELAMLAKMAMPDMVGVPNQTIVLNREASDYVPTRYVKEDTEPETITSLIQFDSRDDVFPLSRIERAAIMAALHACRGDIQDTARRLEISRATIYRRLRRYGIDPDENRPK